MNNNIDDKKFKLADCYLPSLEEGDYTINFKQTINSTDESYSITKEFRVGLNTKILQDEAVFNVHPAPNELGDFSKELPYIVFNDPSYPWIKSISSDNENNQPIPWLALIVVSEDEIVEEKDIEHSQLKDESKKDKNVFFKYEENDFFPCHATDNIHLITISKKTFKSIMPEKDERRWLVHGKQVELSYTEDVIAKKNGYFSVAIANRFPPASNDPNKSKKNTVHLVAAYLYDSKDILKKINDETTEFVKMISLYHWNIYSEYVETNKKVDPNEKNEPDKSFSTLTQNIAAGTVNEEHALREHFFRNGTKTYSWYYSPIRSLNYKRVSSNEVTLNGEDRRTADGRLIYNTNYGIFDVSYSAAFNLGRLVTLSHESEAQRIVSMRKQYKIQTHLNSLKKEIGIDNSLLKNVMLNFKKSLKEG